MTDMTLRLSCHSELSPRGPSPDEILQAQGFNLGPSTDTPNPRVGCFGQHPTPFLTAELGGQLKGISENARRKRECQSNFRPSLPKYH